MNTEEVFSSVLHIRRICSESEMKMFFLIEWDFTFYKIKIYRNSKYMYI